MSAREEFEAIRADVLSLESRKEQATQLRYRLEPHGQQLGSIGHGAGSDFTSTSNAIMQLEQALEVEQSELYQRLERATAILYGADGRGGLASIAGATVADCIHGYYLQGMSWQEVGQELTDGDRPADYARYKAQRGLTLIDRYGAAYLRER